MKAMSHAISSDEAQRLDDVLLPFQRATKFVAANHGKLLKKYAEQWIAVCGDTVLVASPDREVVRDLVRQQGRKGDGVYVTFLTTKKRTLIL